MTLLRPEWAPFLLAVPLVVLGLWLRDRARRRRLADVLGPRAPRLAAEASVARRRWRRTFFTAALLLAGVAALQPAWGESTRPVEPRGVDLLVCLDVSRSMLARDVPPSRLERARREIRALADRAAGDRLGLVVFAGEARLVIPLTRDRASFVELAALAGPLSVPRGGTDLGAALDTALAALAGHDAEHVAVLLLTDGEDHAERGLRVARAAAQRGITVHCIGFGSARGAKIPVGDEGGESFLRDRAGNEVVSALKPATLRRIADATGGVYVDALEQPHALQQLYEARIEPAARAAFRARRDREKENRYQWPLLAAFLLWIAELGLGERRR